MGLEIVLHSILTSVLGEGELLLYAPAALPTGKGPSVPMKWVAGGSLSHSGRFGEEMNLLSLQEVEARFLGHQSHSLVTIRLWLKRYLKRSKET